MADFTIGRIITSSVRRHFHAMYVTGGENLTRIDPARPVVGCANHSNWWDGFVLYAFAQRKMRDHDFHLAMEERNLARYFFFTWLGVFGMGLSHPAEAVAGLRYAVRLLRGNPSRMAWMFVQGSLTTPHAPIEAKPGAGFVARRADAQLLPVVIRYEWLIESKPTIFISIGPSLPAATEPGELALRMNALYAELGVRIDASGPDEMEAVYAPRLSLNKRWDYLGHVVTGRRAKFERENRG